MGLDEADDNAAGESGREVFEDHGLQWDSVIASLQEDLIARDVGAAMLIVSVSLLCITKKRTYKGDKVSSGWLQSNSLATGVGFSIVDEAVLVACAFGARLSMRVSSHTSTGKMLLIGPLQWIVLGVVTGVTMIGVSRSESRWATLMVSTSSHSSIGRMTLIGPLRCTTLTRLLFMVGERELCAVT